MKNILTISISALVFTVGILLYAFSEKEQKTAYIELGKIYGDFELKKELQSKLTNVQQARKTVLDSMRIQLEFFANTLNNVNPKADKSKTEQQVREFEIKKQQYYQMEKTFSEDNEKLSSEYEEQIWKQLNQYIKDYGKANDYEYIYGAGGSGSLMYAKESNDITEKVKEYVNERYQGKK